METHEVFIKRSFELAEQSVDSGDHPFGALIVDENNQIVSKGLNTGKKDIVGHAEINAIRKMISLNPEKKDYSKYTLYTDFEPCAMCSFIIRDVGIGRVVYSGKSPFWGGVSRWNILTDTNIRPEFTTFGNSTKPEIVAGVLSDVTNKKFSDLGWKMHIDKNERDNK